MNSFVISREGRRNSLTSVSGKFDFHCFSLSLFVASCFRGESRPFYTQQGSQENDNNQTQPSRTGRRRQTEFLIDQTFPSSDCDGCAEQKSASLWRRRSAGWQAPYRRLPAPLDRHTNDFVQQHTAEHHWSAGTLPVPSSQVKPPTVRLSTIKFIRKEKKYLFQQQRLYGTFCFLVNLFSCLLYLQRWEWKCIWCGAKQQIYRSHCGKRLWKVISISEAVQAN